jgi:hypothetical protein
MSRAIIHHPIGLNSMHLYLKKITIVAHHFLLIPFWLYNLTVFLFSYKVYLFFPIVWGCHIGFFRKLLVHLFEPTQTSL